MPSINPLLIRRLEGALLLRLFIVKDVQRYVISTSCKAYASRHGCSKMSGEECWLHSKCTIIIDAIRLKAVQGDYGGCFTILSFRCDNHSSIHSRYGDTATSC